MRLDVNISDIFKTKPRWVAEGIVLHSDKLHPERHAYSPKTGMVFTARVVPDATNAVEIDKWIKDPATGQWSSVKVRTRARAFKKVYFSIDQSIRSAAKPDGVLDPIDPATGKPVIVYPPSFYQTFQDTPFYEVAENLLVAQAICIDRTDVTEEGKPEGEIASKLPWQSPSRSSCTRPMTVN
jgi:hypothetical protein